MLLAVSRAGVTNRYSRLLARLMKKLDTKDLMDALRLCGWCLCIATVRRALEWVSSSMMKAATATVSDLQCDDCCSIELVSDSSKCDGRSTCTAGGQSSTKDIHELDASYIYV